MICQHDFLQVVNIKALQKRGKKAVSEAGPAVGGKPGYDG